MLMAMPMVREKSPLHILLEMKDMQGSKYLVEGKEDGMIAILPSSGRFEDGVSFNFEHFALYVWEKMLAFVGDNGKSVPAFTSIEDVCKDLKDEKFITRVYHLEERKMYWYIPQRGIFVHEKGTVTPAGMPMGSYIYEPFSLSNGMTETLSDKVIRFWTEMLAHENPADFIEKIGVTRERYKRHESIFNQMPQFGEAVVRMYPWFKKEWLSAFLIYMLN